MPVNIPQPVNPPQDEGGHKPQKESRSHGGQEPLSGSKKVKNRNHSRQNHGEGS
ncbi:small acid-soluble spore protein P [Gorillibacterium timonense]|uniref:small acid-soluble spore protein P n=1 Tax=Gorillibacterium timonense TaxID=1689269 RepID=UPI00071C3AC6|nr:small acid-soluble spore protein P [Gorillibacterium timonense]